MPPINDWIQSLYDPPNPDITPLADLRHRFPSLAEVTSFAAIISISSKYLKANAIKKAGDHAASFFANNPRINLATIQQDSGVFTNRRPSQTSFVCSYLHPPPSSYPRSTTSISTKPSSS